MLLKSVAALAAAAECVWVTFMTAPLTVPTEDWSLC